jgi:REP-associated tyrosine transposase
VLPRRPRLAPDLYVGLRRYFLTFCSAQRQALFVERDVVDLLLLQMVRSGEQHEMGIIAYCFMPDHVHLLVEARCESADAIAFVHQAKQRSGYAVARAYRRKLWPPSFYDRILRDDEATLSVARYILENPVRAGLVNSPDEYPSVDRSSFQWSR